MSDDNAPIYGIDLGTTYSCIAAVGDMEKPEVIPNAEGLLTTPSVVFFEGDSNVIVGKVAKANAKLTKDQVCSAVKRNMGSDDFRFLGGGKEYRAEAVSALILKKVVGDALEQSGQPRDGSARIVVTVPAYFGSKEREATKRAGRLAGYDVASLLDEPVAAAFAYGLSRAKEDQHVLVYDLGGGTFDVTVVRVNGTSARCIATDGVRLLGGADWDERIVTLASERFLQEHGAGDGDPRDDPQTVQRLAIDSEEAKIALSQREKAAFLVTHGGKETRVEITRGEFEDRTRDLLEKTVDFCRKVIEEAKSKGVSRIDKLLLVGGSSKMPAVKSRLKETLGMEGEMYRPDQSVAEGAALVGDLIKKGLFPPKGETEGVPGLPGPVTLGFVSAKSLGIVAIRDGDRNKKYVSYIIGRNSSLPVTAKQVFGTIEANQVSVILEIKEQREAESEVPDENETIHEEPLALPPGLPARTPIEVTFTLDLEAVLQVQALEPSSGRNINVRIKREGMMTEQELKDQSREIGLMVVT